MSRARGNGEGTIYKNDTKGLWIAQYSYGRRPDGKRYRKTLYGKTRKEVKEKLETFIASVNSGTASAGISTIEEILQSYIDGERDLNILSDSSYHRKQATLNIIKSSYIASRPVQKLTSDDILVFLSSITHYSNSYINKIYSLLRKAFEIATERGLIGTNPMQNSAVKKPKSDKETKKISAFTVDEQRIIIGALTKPIPDTTCNRYNAQWMLSLFTGMRIGEINALNEQDIDMDNKIIHIKRTITKDEHDRPIIGKTTKTYAGMREISLSDSAYKVLAEYLSRERQPNPQNLLFYNHRNHSPISSNQSNMEFKRLCKSCGIEREVNQHMLRHTFATRCIESGMPAKVLQKILGHTDIKTTLNTYCDVFESYESEHVGQAENYLKSVGLAL